MGDTPGHTLRQAVVARHGSIHAFCKRHPELTRSTVYQVMNDRYPGNVARQSAIIREALEGGPAGPARISVPSAQDMAGVIIAARCARCRRPDRRGCRGCRMQAEREAQALREFLEVLCQT
jgi:hypothetical protein